MKHLSSEALRRARAFLMDIARPLERAQYEHRFEEGSPESVIEEITAFANSDGGFGRGIEPDLRTPSSSALCTAWALKVLDAVGCPAEHPLVAGAAGYLKATFDTTRHHWRVIPEDANDHPHAPWWHDENGSLERTFDAFRIIPRVQVVAVLVRYHALVKATWLEERLEEAIGAIEGVSVLGEGGGSDLEYAVYLAESAGLPVSARTRLTARIAAAIPDVVVTDPARWTTYCITPLRACPHPSVPGADQLRDTLEQHLDFVIGQQTAEGCWDPSWSWFGAYPDVWEEAKVEWQGILTLDTLTSLCAYGRILAGLEEGAGVAAHELSLDGVDEWRKIATYREDRKEHLALYRRMLDL